MVSNQPLIVKNTVRLAISARLKGVCCFEQIREKDSQAMWTAFQFISFSIPVSFYFFY